MQERRSAASAAVSALVDNCLSSFSQLPAKHKATHRRLHHNRPSSPEPFFFIPCNECLASTEAVTTDASQPALKQCQQGVGAMEPLFKYSSNHPMSNSAQQIVNALADAVRSVDADEHSTDWDHAMTVLSDAMSSSSLDSGPASTLASVLTAARQLGLLQTVKLALQTLQVQAELQQQSLQAVVAEFDLPTAEHPQQLCTAAWQTATGSQHGQSEAVVGHSEAVTGQSEAVIGSVLAVTDSQAQSMVAEHDSEAIEPAVPRQLSDVQVEQQSMCSQLVAQLQAGQLSVLFCQLSAAWTCLTCSNGLHLV